MEKQIAYGLITIKAFDKSTRAFKGIASTSTPDRMNDVVEPKGALFNLPLPFLHQHDATKPVGHITKAKIVGSDIEIEGYVERFDSPPSLKERVDVAAAELESGLVRGLSIGFNPKEYSFIKETGGIHFTKWEWLELSMVTIPANSEATIRTIKSVSDGLRKAAPGYVAKGVDPPPGASGSQTKPPAGGFFTSKGKSMQSIQQQLAALKEARQSKAARLQELDEARETRGGSFTDEERAEVNGITSEVRDLDDQIQVKQVLANEVLSARPVDSNVVMRSMGATFGFVRKADPDDRFKGQAQTRRIIAKALAHVYMKQGIFMKPSEIAEQRWGKTNPQLVSVMKANEVAGAGSGSGEPWAELVAMDGRYTGDFIEYLYSMTVFDRLPLREIPANVTVKGQDAAATGYWVGESKGIPATVASGSTVNLTPLKVGAISVVSNELLADATPSAEMLVRDSLVEASAQKIDTTFLSTSAASAGVSPAGILQGLSAGTSAGNTPAHVIADMQALLANFITGKYNSDLYLVMPPTLAAALGMMVNSLGLPAFPNSTLTQKGGTFQGYPVVTGHNVGTGDVIMLSPRDIWKIGDTGVQISVSQEAMIEQNSVPSGETDTPTAAANTLTSMFQEESTAIKVVRRINFKLRRTDAVTYIGDAAYNLGS